MKGAPMKRIVIRTRRMAASYTRFGECVALVAMLLLVSVSYLHAQANVGIGTVSPDPSALLDLTSITSGLLPPRMTHAQMNAIPPTVATGDFVFCTDSTALLTPSTYYYYNGSAWVPFMGNYLTNFLNGDGVIYGPLTQQNTLTAGATPIFNVAYAAASGTVTDFGAQIVANASGATAGSATGLTVSAVGSGTGTKATGLVVSATGAAADTTVDATSEIAENGNGIATTSTDGLVLQNLTPATSTVTKQYSPRIDLVGTAWNSTGAVSQTDKFIIENQPQNMAGTTTSNLVFSDIINGGASTQDAVISSGANLLLGQTSNTEGSLSLAYPTAAFMTTVEPSTTTPTSTFIYNLPAQTSAPLAGQILSITSVTGTGPYTVNLQWGTSATAYTHYTSSVDSVAPITSTSGKMGGLGAAGISFTPIVTGHMLIIMSGCIYTGTGGDAAYAQMYYGTGTAPAHNAALIGTAVGGKTAVQPLGADHVEIAPFMLETYQALTVGTTYWVDAACSSNTGTTSLGQVVVTATELP
jgi:hypothetical protein